MADERKDANGNPLPPAGDGNKPDANPNPTPSAEELQKQNQELQNRLKERDTQIADLETTQATFEARQRQIEEDKVKQSTDTSLKERISRINERRAYDPEGADAEMASLLGEVQTKAAKDAVAQAQQVITQQTGLEKIRTGVKASNPDFDEDVVDVIMQRANQLALSGKYKTADDAVKAATDFVKTKFEGYAQKKNALPPLPPGAGAERGGANNLPPPPEPPKELSPLEELEQANEAKNKRTI